MREQDVKVATRLNVFERYLSVWVALCIVTGAPSAR